MFRGPPSQEGSSGKTLTLRQEDRGVRTNKEEMEECPWQGKKPVPRPRVGDNVQDQILHEQPGTELVPRKQPRHDFI